MTFEITHYTDFKSPYAYLALEATLQLEKDFDVTIDFLPYTLNIPAYLGDVENRDDHQWRKVKYSYMDCRRQANKRGLTLRGPKKIYDSREVDTALLYAKEQHGVPAFARLVFERFFTHTIDVEDRAQIKQAIQDAGLDPSGFDAFVDGPGGAAHDRIRAEAESQGLFGVPAYLIDGELFWGGEKIPEIRDRLTAMGLAK
jgi:2-hydroxychromene-2-carboxylate isomerase